jgi:hypothetical protein
MSVKFAISLPDEDFREIEALRKARGMGRSQFVLSALRFWKEARERDRMVRQYEEGYRRVPENLPELEAWERASAPAFGKEEW